MELKELHDRLFETLCLVDDICKKENVPYFLDGGTEIGSVREKDIIPWDDDVDIKIMRKDYDSFKAAMIKHLPKGYRFIEPEDYSPYFFDFVPRVINENLPMRKETDEDRAYKNYQNRVGVDVFIFDTAPTSPFSRWLMKLKCKTLYGMAMSKRYAVHDEKYTLAQKLTSGVCRLMGKLFSTDTIFSMWNKAMTKYKDRDTEWLFPSNYLIRDLMSYPRDMFARTAEGELRGRKFPIPSEYDKELTILYGDYKNPPKDRSIYISHL